jgi:predicted transcriptional regulator
LADTAEAMELLSLRLPAPLLQELTAQAQALNASRAAVARYALAEGLAALVELQAPTAARSAGPGLVAPGGWPA